MTATAMLSTSDLGFAIATAIFVLAPILAYRAQKNRRRDEEFARALAARRRGARSARVTGTIVSIERTGLTINDQPEIRFQIDARLLDGREVELKFERIVDVLEIPRIQPGRRVALDYDPKDPEGNWTLDFDAEPDASSDEPASDGAAPEPDADDAPPIESTGGRLEGPLWTFGLRKADAWLLPPRAAGLTPLMVIDLLDRHADRGDADRDATVDAAAHLICEALWCTTDLTASSVVWVETSRRKVVEIRSGQLTYEMLEPFMRSLEAPAIAVWGEGGRDLARDGITLRARLPGDPAERTFSGPLAEVVETLVSWLVARGLARRVTPPRWYDPVSAALLPTYARLLDALQWMILADRKNGAIDPPPAPAYLDALDMAFEAAAPGAGAQLEILACVMARYLRRADLLDEPRRQRALALIARATDPEHPLARLAPHLLDDLGDAAAARQRHQRLSIGAGPAYAAWLRGLGEPE